MALFTAAELDRLAAFDAIVDRRFRITSEEKRMSRELDKFARRQVLDPELRSMLERRDRQIAEKRSYYWRNREARLEYQRQHYASMCRDKEDV